MKVMKQFHALEKVERTAEMILPLDLQDPSHMPILEIVMNPIPEKPGHPKEAWNPDHVLIILGRAQTKEQRQKLIYVRAKELETRPNVQYFRCKSIIIPISFIINIQFVCKEGFLMLFILLSYAKFP